ncbi:MAG: response regulator [Desulfomonile tiedjei]|uniref:histidine kinase n=1 Tax=Desulfomonile tiedjei TaxID=2358 RepID=A0A9D6Z2F5_9BACT|nr:response regulator [Desulfomonile tiedjei]
MNLAVNARDAMPNGGVLTIRTENAARDDAYANSQLQDEAENYAILIVSDNGHGMGKETQDRIFEPFFTTKEAGKGTGLGLATVYGIVKQHGGTITCESQPGEGTTFRVYLPVGEMESDRDTATPLAQPFLGTETILLVDDEDPVRDLGKKILAQSGYTVITAANGKEALEIYQEKRELVSLIILDWIMPEMGGKQFLEEIRDIDPKARVLVVSGLQSGGTAAITREHGARGFVGKPYNVREFLKSVREILDEDD